MGLELSPGPETTSKRQWTAIGCFSFGASQARQKGDQIINLRRRQRLVARHCRNAELFLQILEFIFAEGMKAVLVIAQLDGERILVDSHAAKIASGARNYADHQKAFGRGRGRINQRLAQVSRAAARADLSQFGTRCAALAANDVASGASFRAVKFPSPPRVSLRLRVFDAIEREYVTDHAPSFAIVHMPGRRHLGSRDSVSDHVVQSLIVFGAAQRGLIERGTSAADSFDAVTEGALADVKTFAVGQIIGGQSRNGVLPGPRGRNRRREEERKQT